MRSASRPFVRRVTLLSAVLLASAALRAGDRVGTLDQFLRQGLRFSSADLAAVSRGGAAVKTLESDDTHEIVAAGMVRLRATPEFFLERLRDITHFKSDDAVLQIGLFGVSPRAEDLATLKWDRDDLRALHRCRVGECDLRWPAAAIERFRREVDWASPGYEQRAAQLASRMIAELAAAYVEREDLALADDRDRPHPVNPRVQFRTLAGHLPSPLDLVPEFREYLLNFPRATLPGVENFLYWSKEKIAFHSVVSVTHIAVYRPPAGRPLIAVVGSRQVYASRYFDASLGTTVLIDSLDCGARPGALDLPYVNRSRTDELTGF